MISKVLNWVKTDGFLHLETSALIVFVIAAFLPWWIGVLAAILIGAGKELWDRKHGGCASWHDVICDAIGIVLAILICLI